MQESIWGTINLMIEIAFNIYLIQAENGKGIMMPKERASQLSTETREKAVEAGDKLYFESGEPMNAVMGELLGQRLIMVKKVEAECMKLMQQYYKGGPIQENLFGIFADPSGEQELVKIRNGIYLSAEGEEQVFIHKKAGEVFLSPYALEYSSMEGEYYCFSGNASALALYELRSYFPECKDLIIQEESLTATLLADYPTYVEHMNVILPEDGKIAAVDAVPGLYLQRQIDRIPVKETQEIHGQDEIQFEELDDYGEQLDYSL